MLLLGASSHAECLHLDYRIDSYYNSMIHPFRVSLQSHQRGNQPLANRLRFLPCHLNDTEQLLDSNIQASALVAKAGLAEHIHGLLALSRVPKEVNFVEDDVKRVQVCNGRNAKFCIEGLGETKVRQDRAQGCCGNDK